MNKKNTVTLKKPIKRGETEITEITLREPNAGELRGLSLFSLGQMDVESIQKLLIKIGNPILTKPETDQLSLADLTQLGTVIAGFFLSENDPIPNE